MREKKEGDGRKEKGIEEEKKYEEKTEKIRERR